MTILICGSDTFRAREKLKELKNAFVQKHGQNITTLSGENLSLAKLREAILSNSLFDAKRLVVIEKLEDSDVDMDKIKEILSAAPKDNVIILFEEKDIFGADHKYKFEKLTGRELERWAADFAKRIGFGFTLRGLSRLLDVTDGDSWIISSEISKLAGLNKNIIDQDDVDEVVAGGANSSVFKFIDALAFGRKEQALKLLKQELEVSDDPTRLFHLIVRQFRIILQTKDADAKKLGLNQFVINKAREQGARWDLEKLKKTYSQFLDIDFKFKTGIADLKNLLTSLVLTSL